MPTLDLGVRPVVLVPGVALVVTGELLMATVEAAAGPVVLAATEAAGVLGGVAATVGVVFFDSTASSVFCRFSGTSSTLLESASQKEPFKARRVSIRGHTT